LLVVGLKKKKTSTSSNKHCAEFNVCCGIWYGWLVLSVLILTFRCSFLFGISAKLMLFVWVEIFLWRWTCRFDCENNRCKLWNQV